MNHDTFLVEKNVAVFVPIISVEVDVKVDVVRLMVKAMFDLTYCHCLMKRYGSSVLR